MGWRERRKEKKKQVWISILLAAIMIFSAFGIYLGSVSQSEGSYEYKEHKFRAESGKFLTKINNIEVPFYNLPQDVEPLNLSKEAMNLVKGAWVTQVVFNPSQENLQYVELTRFDWNQWWGKPILSGVVQKSDLYQDLPIITCQNGTAQGPVIVLNVSPVLSSHAEGHCLILNGLGVDFLRWRDRILYAHLGILDQE